MKPILIYCYDAWCGWCYGFSPVMKKLANRYAHQLEFEVLSGGMLLPPRPVPFSLIAGFVASEYLNVERLTGIHFGKDYLWHVFNPNESDWYPNSEKPGIALCVFKEKLPALMIDFAADLQYALHFEGRDLTDNESYRHLIAKYQLNADEFYADMNSSHYRNTASDEFSTVSKLGVKGFPALLLQTGQSEIHWIANGYTDYEDICAVLDKTIIKNS